MVAEVDFEIVDKGQEFLLFIVSFDVSINVELFCSLRYNRVNFESISWHSSKLCKFRLLLLRLEL